MSSSAQLYRVVITNANAGNAAPADGFVDPTTTEMYYSAPVHNPSDGLEGTPGGASLATTTAKRRGNLRYQYLLQNAQLMANCYVLDNSFVTNATATSEGSGLSFLLFAEHGPNSFNTTALVGEPTPGAVLIGIPALIRGLARGLATPLVTATYVFDPTSTTTTGLGQNVAVPRFGDRISGPGTFLVGPYAANVAAAESCLGIVVMFP